MLGATLGSLEGLVLAAPAFFLGRINLPISPLAPAPLPASGLSFSERGQIGARGPSDTELPAKVKVCGASSWPPYVHFIEKCHVKYFLDSK